MIIKELTALALAAGLALSTAGAMVGEAEPPESLGEYRITTYCIHCNDPGGRTSASGQRLEYGQVAMNGVPLGTKISIGGEVFTVTDRCGIDGTVDIFIENDIGACRCNTLEYKEVYKLNE